LKDEVYRDDDVSEDEEEEPTAVAPTPKNLVPLHRRGLGAQLAQRMTGAMRFADERALECPVAGKNITTSILRRSILTILRLADRDCGFSESARGCPFFNQP
jgi:hypothetical protein